MIDTKVSLNREQQSQGRIIYTEKAAAFYVVILMHK